LEALVTPAPTAASSNRKFKFRVFLGYCNFSAMPYAFKTYNFGLKASAGIHILE
jgi:hypothetical protein